MSIQQIVVDIVALSGGQLVGRTRMQKTVYLLDALGLQSGAFYYYYNFGPFSDEVADGIADCKFGGMLSEKIGQRRSDGSPFSVFATTKPANQVDRLGDIPRDRAITLLQRFAGVNSTILELAATVHWLVFVEQVQDWRAELVQRKGAKTTSGRMEAAADLLRELGFALP